MNLRIFLPISLDRVQTPIATLLREVALGNPGHQFYAFSNPITDEDREVGGQLWSQPHVHRISPLTALLRRYDVAHHASATRRNLGLSRLARMRSFGRMKHLFTANCEPYSTDPFLPVFETCVSKCDHLVSVSRTVSEAVDSKWGRKSDSVIPNGFASAYYSPDPGCVDPEFGRDFVLYACAMIDRKNPEFFLDLAERMPDRKFVMAGSTRDRPRADLLKKRASGLANVEFVGMVTRGRLRDLMRAALALVWPSDYEGLPLTVVESMGCGLPVIAQPKSALPEVITHGSDGWMYPITRMHDWIDRIEVIAGWNEAERSQFSKVARQSVLDRFCWSRIAAAYGKYYQEIVGEAAA